METDRFIIDKGILTVKEGVDVLYDMEFDNIDIYHVILPSTLKEIKPFTFYKNSIESIVFNEGLEVIGTNAFAYNNIENLKLPMSLQQLGDRAFIGNKIKELILDTNIEEIKKETFKKNKLKKVILKGNIKIINESAFEDNIISSLELTTEILEIKEKAFASNRIEKLNLPDKLKVLDEQVFYQNKIQKINFPESIEIVKKQAFKYNFIEELILNNNLKTIEEEAFYDNKIKELYTNEELTSIGINAFAENNIKKINLNEKLEQIFERAFYNNNIEKLYLTKNINFIGQEAFISNDIESIKFNEKIDTIEEDAFCDNKIKQLSIPKNIKIIKDCAFMLNDIEKIEFEDEPQQIGSKSFKANETIIKGVLLEKSDLQHLGTENINKILKFKKYMSQFNLNIISKAELDLLPDNTKTLNAFKSNYKMYSVLFSEVLKVYPQLKNKNNDFFESFFKLSFLLGIFNENKEQIKIVIPYLLKFLEFHDQEDLNNIFHDFEIKNYNKKLKNITKEYIDNPRYPNLYSKIIKELDEVYKYILKNKKYKISKNNTQRLKLEKENLATNEIIKTLDLQKKNLNILSFDDVIEYYQNCLYDIKPENEALKEITLYLSSFVNSEDFKKIEEIYENRVREDKYFISHKENYDSEYHYEWLSSNDPKNFIIGYEVDCCAKLNETGEDIMTQSIQNPYIKNLVVYKNNKIIGKTTAYYNENYILCNNFEIKENCQDKEKVLKIFKEALLYQIKKMKNNNLVIQEIRVGMSNNDLHNEILKNNLEITKKNLLSNYKFNNYMGDANSIIDGQLILYKKI